MFWPSNQQLVGITCMEIQRKSARLVILLAKLRSYILKSGSWVSNISRRHVAISHTFTFSVCLGLGVWLLFSCIQTSRAPTSRPWETDFLTCFSNKQVQIKSLFPLCYPSGGPGGRVNGGHSRAPGKSVTRCDHRQLPICGWWPVSLAQFALSHVELKSGCGGLHSVQCTGVAVATQDNSNPVELGLVTPTVWAKPRRWQRVWDTIDSHL